MRLLFNPYRGTGFPGSRGLVRDTVSTDPSRPQDLLTHCPAAARTPLLEMRDLADAFSVTSILLKDESDRMGLGSFKALGGAYAIAQDAMYQAKLQDIHPESTHIEKILSGRVYACASAGNHGLSVAAGAKIFGAAAVIYLPDSASQHFEERLRQLSASVVRPGGNYEETMVAADAAVRDVGWTLLSDSSWPGYIEWPARIMEGYLIVAAEVADEVSEPPTHVFLQAGVGGFAAALSAFFRSRWGDAPTIIVVEPDLAPALTESIRLGVPTRGSGPESIMGRMDCKAPSHLALAQLAYSADWFATISDSESVKAVETLGNNNISTTPSGAGGFAALPQVEEHRQVLGISRESRVLAIITEGPDDTSGPSIHQNP